MQLIEIDEALSYAWVDFGAEAVFVPFPLDHVPEQTAAMFAIRYSRGKGHPIDALAERDWETRVKQKRSQHKDLWTRVFVEESAFQLHVQAAVRNATRVWHFTDILTQARAKRRPSAQRTMFNREVLGRLDDDNFAITTIATLGDTTRNERLVAIARADRPDCRVHLVKNTTGSMLALNYIMFSYDGQKRPQELVLVIHGAGKLAFLCTRAQELIVPFHEHFDSAPKRALPHSAAEIEAAMSASRQRNGSSKESGAKQARRRTRRQRGFSRSKTARQ